MLLVLTHFQSSSLWSVYISCNMLSYRGPIGGKAQSAGGRNYVKDVMRAVFTWAPLGTDISPNSTWLVTSRLDTTRHVRRVGPMHFAVLSLSNSAARRARHVKRVVSCRDVTWRGKWNLGCNLRTRRHDRTLPQRSTRLFDDNFITRQLFKDTYQLYSHLLVHTLPYCISVH